MSSQIDFERHNFERYIELAKTGELQAAESRLGPISYNAYYFDNSSRYLLGSIAMFIGPVLTVAHEAHNQNGSIFTDQDVAAAAKDMSNSEFFIERSLYLADNSMFITKLSADSDPTQAYALTKKGLETEPLAVYPPSFRVFERLLGATGLYGFGFYSAFATSGYMDNIPARAANTLFLGGTFGTFTTLGGSQLLNMADAIRAQKHYRSKASYPET